MRRWLAFWLVLLAGCEAQPRYVPVSGKVMLNGKPVVGVAVVFQPLPAEGAKEAPAPESIGETDANGEYTLRVVSPTTEQDGAAVGRHRVRFESVVDQQADDDRRRPGWTNRIPVRYGVGSKETFVVPAGGTTEADFDLKVP